MSEADSSARARLIATRRGAWVDESLFPEARRECVEIIEQLPGTWGRCLGSTCGLSYLASCGSLSATLRTGYC